MSRRAVAGMVRSGAGPVADGAPSAFTIMLIVLACLHVASRILISPAVQFDEAEQVLLAQHLAWGYNPQPPLYDWLQWAVFQVVGTGVPGLALLKMSVLGATYWVVWRTGLRLGLQPRAAIGSAAALELIPSIGWDSVRDMSHTVLLTLLTACTLLALVRAFERPSAGRHAVLGAALGLGMLSKYSFVLFALALAGAVLAEELLRRRLCTWRLGISLGVAVALFAGHGFWLLDHWSAVGEDTVAKTLPDPRFVVGRLEGLWSLIEATLSCLALFGVSALVLAWAARPARGSSALSNASVRNSGLEHAGRENAGLENALPGNGSLGNATSAVTTAPVDEAVARIRATRFWYHLALALGVIFLLLIVGVGATRFKPRWLHPLIFWVPLAVFANSSLLAARRHGQRYGALLLVVALLIFAASTARPWLPAETALNQPTDRLAQVLRRTAPAMNFANFTVVTPDRLIGAGLQIAFPGATVCVLGDSPLNGRQCLWALTHDSQHGQQPVLLIAPEPNAGTWLRTMGAETPPTLWLPLRHAPPGTLAAHFSYQWTTADLIAPSANRPALPR